MKANASSIVLKIKRSRFTCSITLNIFEIQNGILPAIIAEIAVIIQI
jgi:hypothetical protein